MVKLLISFGYWLALAGAVCALCTLTMLRPGRSALSLPLGWRRPASPPVALADPHDPRGAGSNGSPSTHTLRPASEIFEKFLALSDDDQRLVLRMWIDHYHLASRPEKYSEKNHNTSPRLTVIK